MCNFCGEGGNEAGGYEDAAFDMGSFLDMCVSQTDSRQAVPASAYEMEDFFAAIPVHPSFKGGEEEAETELIGSGAQPDAAEGVAVRQRQIQAVMGWASAQLEAAGYGRGRVVTVTCPPGVTTISLLDITSPLELTVRKGIGDVTVADVRRAVAEAAASGCGGAAGAAPRASALSGRVS